MARLRNLHPFVSATLKAAEGRRSDESGRIRIAPTAGVIPIAVSRRELRRAMRLVHTLLRLAQTRGHDIVAAENHWGVFRGVAIAIRTHHYPIRISELTSAVLMTDAERERSRLIHGARENAKLRRVSTWPTES